MYTRTPRVIILEYWLFGAFFCLSHFALAVVMIWFTLFNEGWKRKRSELVARWNLDEFKVITTHLPVLEPNDPTHRT